MNQPHPPNPLRILCAEDDPFIGQMLVHLFTRAGYSADHARDGLVAWDKISHDLGRFDVIITDHQMPGLTGLELVGLLREANYGGRIIVHSGTVTDGDAAAYHALGVDQILAKASRPDQLLSAVEVCRTV